jgi:RepB DNA-primase from phage plasmid
LTPQRAGSPTEILHKTANIVSRTAPAIPLQIKGLMMRMNVQAMGRGSKMPTDKTTLATQLQVTAMASDLFEIGLYNPDAGPINSVMIPRVWDSQAVLKSVPWLRHQNAAGRNIYIRPKGEHDLSLVDDLTDDALLSMKEAGFNPALIVETSPGNHQAWLKHPEPLSREMSTAAARALAEKFGGDRGAADWRHFGRLAGFTNRKAKYRDEGTGLSPFVRLIEAGGWVYPEAQRFLAGVRTEVERHQAEREQLREQIAQMALVSPNDLKTIDGFRADARYGGDGTRIDLAYALYALSHGASLTEVEAVIRSRDLSHKGSDRRQSEYVERTIKKALATIERGR